MRLRLVKSTCNEYNSVSFVRRIQPQENDEQGLVMKGECVCVNTNLWKYEVYTNIYNSGC